MVWDFQGFPGVPRAPKEALGRNLTKVPENSKVPRGSPGDPKGRTGIFLRFLRLPRAPWGVLGFVVPRIPEISKELLALLGVPRHPKGPGED